ncbi:hypothetical protein [Streptomyces sp. NPDC050600]|uniref:hypothetical protein n=1 Tax=Streptomyces sp. NPDC050600 TaxID=3157213 RepID=UPI003444E21A
MVLLSVAVLLPAVSLVPPPGRAARRGCPPPDPPVAEWSVTGVAQVEGGEPWEVKVQVGTLPLHQQAGGQVGVEAAEHRV